MQEITHKKYFKVHLNSFKALIYNLQYKVEKVNIKKYLDIKIFDFGSVEVTFKALVRIATFKFWKDIFLLHAKNNFYVNDFPLRILLYDLKIGGFISTVNL